jgi:hypothetical protein
MVFKKDFNLFKSKIFAFSIILFSTSFFGIVIANSIATFGDYQNKKEL